MFCHVYYTKCPLLLAFHVHLGIQPLVCIWRHYLAGHPDLCLLHPLPNIRRHHPWPIRGWQLCWLFGYFLWVDLWLDRFHPPKCVQIFCNGSRFYTVPHIWLRKPVPWSWWLEPRVCSGLVLHKHVRTSLRGHRWCSINFDCLPKTLPICVRASWLKTSIGADVKQTQIAVVETSCSTGLKLDRHLETTR